MVLILKADRLSYFVLIFKKLFAAVTNDTVAFCKKESFNKSSGYHYNTPNFIKTIKTPFQTLNKHLPTLNLTDKFSEKNKIK